MTRLELSIAWRYLRSRRDSKLFSLISVIAIGGVIVGVSALIVIIGVMNGLQNDLREKILVGSPDIRVLPFGDDMTMVDWQQTLETVRKQPGVVAAAPFIHTQAVANAGHRYNEGVMVVGIERSRGRPQKVTTIGRQRCTATSGSQRRWKTTRRRVGGACTDRFGVLPATRSTSRLRLAPGSTPRRSWIPKSAVRGHRNLRDRMYEYDNPTCTWLSQSRRSSRVWEHGHRY